MTRAHVKLSGSSIVKFHLCLKVVNTQKPYSYQESSKWQNEAKWQKLKPQPTRDQKDSYQSINDYKRNLGDTACGKGMREVCYCLLLQENDIPDWIMPKEKIFLCGLRKHKGQCEHITWKRARELGTATNKYTPALGSYLLLGQSSLNSSARQGFIWYKTGGISD